MNVTFDEINLYLKEIKNAVQHDRYRIVRNDRRQYNQDLFIDYVIDEAKEKEILLSLEISF